MSTRTGGGFGGSYLAEHLLRTRQPRRGELANYWDWAHYQRVCASDRRRAERARRLGIRPPPPQQEPVQRWS